MQTRSQKLLQTVEDARYQLSIGRSKFYEEVNAGRLMLIKVGGKSLVPQASIDSFIEARIAESKAPA